MANIPSKTTSRGWRRLLNAFSFSFAGYKAAWQNEEAFRQEAMLAIVMIPLGLVLGRNGIERSLLVGTCFLVLIVELLNSGLESIVDRVSDEHHELSARAKDMGSGAVLLSLTVTVTTWSLILWDRLAT